MIRPQGVGVDHRQVEGATPFSGGIIRLSAHDAGKEQVGDHHYLARAQPGATLHPLGRGGVHHPLVGNLDAIIIAQLCQHSRRFTDAAVAVRIATAAADHEDEAFLGRQGPRRAGQRLFYPHLEQFG